MKSAALLALLFLCLSGCAQPPRHSVVLVSVDGLRSDDARGDSAANLLAMAAHGASAPEGMLPAYPSQRTPNLLTLVTGLYPEHHGMVADSFYDGDRRYSSSEAASSGWFTGVPLWVLAEQQGMRTACLFWPGTPANPRDDADMPDAVRVDRILAWLRLPESERPRLVAASLAAVADAGRRYGPDTPQTRAAVQSMNAQIGRLRAGIAALHLPVNLVVVSDHGMAKTEGGWIDLDTYTHLNGFRTAGALLYAPTEGEAQRVYEDLRIADARFKVYRRRDLPRELHYDRNARVGDPVIVPNMPVAVQAHPEAGGNVPDPGSGGYDPRLVPEMKAVFYAEGPDIRAGVKLRSFENVNVFPFLAELLGLQTPKVDGSAGVLAPARVQATSTPPR